ncbi:glucan phosphorylase [Pediococcus claussenii]|nr:glycogen/starch/alpha-glucan phosphorylase [Pediococcus claussenii]ANZ70523.1 glucan phosphorylase [Pediococcus claussenii]ANZ72337.1 glucan phosphorylase [Pediococcus claussenii]
MNLTKNQFKEDFLNEIHAAYATDLDGTSAFDQFTVLGRLINHYNGRNYAKTTKKYFEEDQKEVYYFSIEFLPGRMLKSNLLNLGILNVVREGITDLGLDFGGIVESEPDPGLGNGGLGRLAACFMDSMASIGMAGNGNGIRYRYGLFKQVFINGYQVELEDDWLKNGNVWEIRRENKACLVRFGGNVWMRPTTNNRLEAVYENTEDVLAVPYDTGMIGYQNDVTNTLRLWSAEVPPAGNEKYYTHEQRDRISQITQVLYPDDSSMEGRILRLRQEYFFSSAGIQSIIRFYRKNHKTMDELPKQVAVHINDTHPTLVIPEMMRILMDECELGWDQAWKLTTECMSYTNHTILQEALEKWQIEIFKELLPRIYQIVEEIDRRYREEMLPKYGEDIVNQTAPLGDGQVRMAYLAVIGSHSVNGVAPLHTELLEKDVLKELFYIYPTRFNNKTNGITDRRWVQISNEPLSNLIDSAIGKEWRNNPKQMELLGQYSDDDDFLEKFANAKKNNKIAFAKFVKETMDIEIDPEAIFDVQIKRLHAYKRQLLHVLEIIREYLQIKDNPQAPFTKRVHIFGAKAAPSYFYAKEIIKIINALAELVNNDPEINDKLKVVFVPNYGVSIAEKIIPAADVSEQTSTASKEASGTSNMKLMSNGVLLLGTMDGANIDIVNAAGKSNAYTFGLTVAQVYNYYENHSYRSVDFYEQNDELKRVLNTLIDGTIPGIKSEGQDVYDALIRYNDEYFVLADYADYVEKQKQISNDFLNKKAWNKRALANVTASGEFSSDYTIERYGDDIWNVPHTKELD